MTGIDLSVNICGVEWKNPIATASGTYSYFESSRYYKPDRLGCITTKGVSINPWNGNPGPRIAETYGGMLNSIGLENPGIDAYLSPSGELRMLKKAGATVMANIAGHTVREYCEAAEKIASSEADMIELNISCPNVECGGLVFGRDPKAAGDLTKEVKRHCPGKPLVVKLSPNVTDITTVALSVQEAGADAVSMINTLLGMRIDTMAGKPVLAKGSGGLSGPAIHPVAVYMVYECAKILDIPIIAMGGVSKADDALEFFYAGAKAVAVGTAAIVDPEAPVKILAELEKKIIDRREGK